MYEKDGRFGRVRLKNVIMPEKLKGVLDYSPSCGWHKCNDLYRTARRDEGDFMESSLMLFTVDGHGVAETNGETYHLRRNSVMLMPRDVPHEYYTAPGELWEFYWLHVSGGNCEGILSHMATEYGGTLTVSCMPEIAGYIELMLSAQYRYFSSELAMARMLSKIMLALLDDVARPRGAAPGKNALALKVIEYIETHYARRLRLSDLSGEMFLSPEHIIRIFKSETGQTPYQYYKKYRLQKAHEMLEFSDLTVKEVAARLGYCSESAFIAQFRDEMRISPAAYRKKNNFYPQ